MEQMASSNVTVRVIYSCGIVSSVVVSCCGVGLVVLSMIRFRFFFHFLLPFLSGYASFFNIRKFRADFLFCRGQHYTH